MRDAVIIDAVRTPVGKGKPGAHSRACIRLIYTRMRFVNSSNAPVLIRH